MSETEEPREEPDQPQIQIVVREDLAGGVWANLVLSQHSAHEITLDFCRMDPHVRHRATLVARVSMSPVLLAQLQDLLNRAWQTWSTQQLADVPEMPQAGAEPAQGEPENEQGTEDGDDPGQHRE